MKELTLNPVRFSMQIPAGLRYFFLLVLFMLLPVFLQGCGDSRKAAQQQPDDTRSQPESASKDGQPTPGESVSQEPTQQQPAGQNPTAPDKVSTDSQDQQDRKHFDEKKIVGDSRAEVARLFGDWDKPDVAFFVTGRQHGYIEPCGCTGLANQKGGLLRRHSLAKALSAHGWNLVKLDAGNQVRRFGPQPEIKFATTARTLTEIFKYDAIGFGRDDLRLPTIELVSTMQNLQGVGDNLTNHPFLCCNVTLFADFKDASFEQDKMISTYKLIESGGKKVCVTAILGEEHFDAIRSDDLTIRSADEGIEAVWPEMKKQEADVYVLIAHTSIDDTNRLANQHPYFDVVITAGGAGEPTLEPEIIKTGDHTSRVVQVGTKGMYAGVVAYYGDKKEFRYQRVDLSDAYEDSEEIKKVFIDYQRQVEMKIFANLKDNMVPHPSGAEFVGSAVCADCHADAHDVWKDGFEKYGDKFGPHTHATKSLLEPNERNWVVRKFDPECLSCHVTGWNPAEYYPYKTGYLNETNTLLHANGCENCHGPGSLHVKAEEADENVADFRKMVRLTLKDAEQKCLECHDLDNSPDFHEKGAFEKFWQRIDHSGLRE